MYKINHVHATLQYFKRIFVLNAFSLTPKPRSPKVISINTQSLERTSIFFTEWKLSMIKIENLLSALYI